MTRVQRFDSDARMLNSRKLIHSHFFERRVDPLHPLPCLSKAEKTASDPLPHPLHPHKEGAMMPTLPAMSWAFMPFLSLTTQKGASASGQRVVRETSGIAGNSKRASLLGIVIFAPSRHARRYRHHHHTPRAAAAFDTTRCCLRRDQLTGMGNRRTQKRGAEPQ